MSWWRRRYAPIAMPSDLSQGRLRREVTSPLFHSPIRMMLARQASSGRTDPWLILLLAGFRDSDGGGGTVHGSRIFASRVVEVKALPMRDLGYQAMGWRPALFVIADNAGAGDLSPAYEIPFHGAAEGVGVPAVAVRGQTHGRAGHLALATRGPARLLKTLGKQGKAGLVFPQT